MSSRIEKDSLGQIEVPGDALYGAQTQRAVHNFAGMARPMPVALIHCLAQLKSAAAEANAQCGAIDPAMAQAIRAAASAVANGDHDQEFPVSVFQTGSGTSTNMNMNEVLARLAGEGVHPNDHVNCSQSSNDIIPSALQATVAKAISGQLLPALEHGAGVIAQRADELADICKTGRTHLMDAMPVTLGQELGAWVAQLEDCAQRLRELMPRLCALPVGGSAVGTGVNVPDGFPEAVVVELSGLLGLSFRCADNRFARMASQDVAVEASGCLRAVAVSLSKVNNDLRWMGSGPLAGLGEISLKPLQPGSSIMPGKVNPVLPEAVLMVCAEVIGNDATVVQAGTSGNFQLNVMLPLVADKLCTSIALLTGALTATAETVRDFSVHEETLRAALARNPMLATALNTRIGYEAATEIAKRSYAEQRPVLDVALECTGIAEEELRDLLDPRRLAGVL
ncbi:MAG: class II fumarate hydratase [Halieaceae bacterium]|jgi:fumarate hydratase class II|nr:class II fumarate hydratase [Halieaceae bacterium]